MTKEKKFYIFEPLFRGGAWKTWGLAAILSGTLMALTPKLFYDPEIIRNESNRIYNRVELNPGFSNIEHNRVDKAYFDIPKNRAY